jgi:hypothetical protein
MVPVPRVWLRPRPTPAPNKGNGESLMIDTGKKARRTHGTRVACKRAKTRKTRERDFGALPVSTVAGNAAEFIRKS